MAKPQYGSAHQRRRKTMLPKAIGTPCPRCGRPMLKGMPLDAGHTVDVAIDPQSKADRIECRHCNRSAGGKLGARRSRFRPSRSW